MPFRVLSSCSPAFPLLMETLIKVTCAPLQHANGGVCAGFWRFLPSPPPFPPQLRQEGRTRVAVNPATRMGLVQVGGGGSEQIDRFSTAKGSTGNSAFPIPQAVGVGDLSDAFGHPSALAMEPALWEGQAGVAACLCPWVKGQKGE